MSDFDELLSAANTQTSGNLKAQNSGIPKVQNSKSPEFQESKKLSKAKDPRYKKTSYWVTEERLLRFKQDSIGRGIDMSDILNALIELYLDSPTIVAAYLENLDS